MSITNPFCVHANRPDTAKKTSPKYSMSTSDVRLARPIGKFLSVEVPLIDV
jgi:hypothetical protein